MAQTQNTESENHKNQQVEKHYDHTNELINETSPYLLQHAHNPVNWHAWNDKTLEKAKRENKLIIVSIGYAACHWCHVMEHESFEDSTVAAIMNDNFIAIKVDREERPDIDNIYMNAAYFTSGRGGWPLNAIALPDGKPFYGGTYFRKDDWTRVLNYFSDAYVKDKPKLEEEAKKMEEGIKSTSLVVLNKEKLEYEKSFFTDVWYSWKSDIDFEKGGPKAAPKFPMPSNWDFLLSYGKIHKNPSATEAALTTLDRMATGGIYDHLAGGFARYSVDDIWLVPHFEKMLYDNGQLVSLYSKAYQATKKQMYKDVVYETLEWVEREMTNEIGGFYSSLDADSEGEEGKYYVWSQKEIEDILGENAHYFIKHYGVQEKGNFEGHNILVEPLEEEASAKRFNNMSVEQLRTFLDQSKKTLFAEREKRIRPGLDDKILTAWNALMLKGYVDAYTTFNEPKFLKAALKNANFISDKCMQKDNRLNRNYKNGKSNINAFIQDYSLVIDAFISLYQATFDEKWLYKADDLMQYCKAHFFDEKSQMFYFTSDLDKKLLTRDIKTSDNVISCGNSVMAKNLYFLGDLLYKEDYKKWSKQMLNNVSKTIEKQPRFYANWLQLALLFNSTPYEVAIVGADAIEKRLELGKSFLPNTLFLGGKDEGTLELLKMKAADGVTRIFVCQNKSCKFPVEESKEALNLIKF